MDIIEEQNRVLVRADLPGMAPEDIGVELAEGILTITGERTCASETKKGRVHRVERA